MKMVKTIGLFVLLLILISSCEDETEPNLATEIEMDLISLDVTFTSIHLGGLITITGGEKVISQGICWSDHSDPTVNDNRVESQDNVNLMIDGRANTTYYFRAFCETHNGIVYSEQGSFKTRSMEDTRWILTTAFPINSLGYEFTEIHSQVDFYGDGTTKFNELDLPGHCPDCFIREGVWNLSGNLLTYIWEGADPSESTIVFTGELNQDGIQGTFRSSLEINWWATPIEKDCFSQVSSFDGTICCMSGLGQALPGDTLSYHYISNLDWYTTSWEVLEGDIKIERGQGMSSCTVSFGENFNGGAIRAIGKSRIDELQCSETFEIRLL